MNDEEKLLNAYRTQIINFENNYVKDIFNNYKNYKRHLHEGYLINLESFEDLKYKIEKYFSGHLRASETIENLSKLKSLEINSSTYLINMLFNGNKYIIINRKLWDLFGQKEKLNVKISYKIEEEIIIFNLEDNIQLKFNCWKKDNIIESLSFTRQNNFNIYSTLESNYYNIDKIYKKILAYYNFENEIVDILNKGWIGQKEKDRTLGFLVDGNWFKNWKIFSNYEEIKKSFEQSEEEKLIKDKIIFFEEINKKLQKKISKIITIKFKSKNDFFQHLKNNSLVLVNYNFVFNFEEKTNDSMFYSISKNNIKLYFNNKETLDIKSNNNIITTIQSDSNTTQSISDLTKIHLKHLIKYYYYQKKIKSLINSSNVPQKDEKNEIYFISKNSIDKYKQYYNYPLLCKILDSPNFHNCDYNNLEVFYLHLIQNIESSYKDYFESIGKKISSNKFIFVEEDYDNSTKLNYDKNYDIPYLDDFEILNDDVISIFEMFGMIKKDFLIKGEYIIDKGLMLFIFDKNDQKYIQINSFDSQNDKFIIEYLIKDLINYVPIYFKEKGIEYFINKIEDNKIYYGEVHLCNCFKMMNTKFLTENQPQNTIELDDPKNSKYIKEIISLLLHYALFQLDIKNKISLSQSQSIQNINTTSIQTYKYYIVNKNIIMEFINSFWDDKINELIQKYKILSYAEITEDILKFILEKNDLKPIFKSINCNINNFKEKIKDRDFYKIEISSQKEGSDLLNFPKEFMFLDELLFSKFLHFLGIHNNEIKNNCSKILLNFNYGNIVFKSEEAYFLGNKLYLIYVYSIDSNSNKEMVFNLELILSFSNFTIFLNNSKDIIRTNIRYNSFFLNDNFEKQYKLKIHLIKKKKDDQYENKLNKNLESLVELYKEYLNMNHRISLSITQPTTTFQIDEKYYIINRNFINILEEILHFKEIKVILDKHKQFYLNFDSNKDYCLNNIKNILSNETKDKLVELEQDSNFEKLNNYDLYKLENGIFNQTILYYKNFIIINEQIMKILKSYTSSISLITESVDCIFDNKNFFIKLREIIINGYIKENSQLIIDYLIKPKFSYHLEKIYEKIKKEGIRFIQKYLLYGKIELKCSYGLNNYYYIEAELFNISQKGQINDIDSKSSISEKLKKIILLSLELQSRGTIELNDKLAEEVYLINPKILTDTCLNEINSLLQNNTKVSNLLLKYKFSKSCLNSNQLEEIISNLNEQKLKIIDKNYLNKKFRDLEINGQKVKLKMGKEINIYREFIMIRKQIYNNISSEININKIPKVFYSKIQEGDLIIDEKKEFIIYGRIDDNNYFNVKYIFYFSDDSDLFNDLKIITNSGIKNYINDRTIFNTENINDCISPIFSNKNIIGYAYKLSPGINDYNNKMDYSAYLENSNIIRAFLLYDNYEKIKEKMNYSFSLKKEYYLIKKQVMKDIKNLYYYKDIKEILDKINPNERKQFNQSKLLLYLLKYLPENIFKEFIGEGSEIKKMDKGLIEPDIEPVYLNKEQAYMIYKDFEMIEPEIAKKFFKDLNEGSYLGYSSKDNNITECILKDGKVMVKYTPNLFNNQKDIVSMGNINNDYTFINEYVLIYNKYFSLHMSELEKTNLNNYLGELKFVNNQNPIVINQYIDIGTIIKLNPQTNNEKINDYDYNRMDIEEKPSDFNKPYGSDYNFNGDDNVKKNGLYGNEDENYDDFVDDFDDNSDDEEYNLNPPTKYNSVKECFIYPPLIGLDNIGATCYMNATLQCLCNMEKFVDYFKFNSHLINIVKNDTDKSKLCSSFKLLIENLWPDPDKKNKKKSKTSIGFNRSFPYQVSNKYESETFYGGNKNNKSYPPEEFKKKISKMNPLFEGVAANDAKDLVQFLIMTLHKELNKAGESNVNNAINLDQRNKQLMFQVFAQDFMNSNKSVISDLFYGVNYNITQCGFCNTQTFNYQTYFFLIFPLEEVRIFKSQNNINYNYNCFANNEVNIYDCFFYDQKINYMTGSNIMYCNFCRQTCNTSMRTILSTGPEILIIILNRGQGIQFNVKINFLEEINLENFIEMKQTGCIYKLIGVITHIGESGMGGHFIAYSKNPISNEWNKYNDSIVSPVSNFKKDVIDFAMPYLLFYQKST